MTWPSCLGELVRTDAAAIARNRQDVSALDRRIAGVAHPRTTADVVAIVRAANAAGGTLYPISTGCNWGLGSRLPVRDGAVVVDLGALDRIESIDERHGVAIIQPGVTQRRLTAALAGTRFRIDVTGSAAETSVLGNALDRGIAHDGPRVERTRILEVVLGTGERVAFDHAGTRAAVASLYRWGIGPALHDLFFQSSYGIVTRAAIRLEPRTRDVAVLRCALSDEHSLTAMIDAARALVDRGVLPSSLHVSNRARSRSVLGGLLARSLDAFEARRLADERIRASWSLSVTLRGDPAQIRTQHRLARRSLSAFGPVTLTRARRARLEAAVLGSAALPLGAALGRGRVALARATAEVFGHSLGTPSDGGLASLAFSVGLPAGPLDAGDTGTIFALPLVPLGGREVASALAIVRDVIEREHQLVPYITLNGIGRVFELVLNVTFDRRVQAAVRNAHAAIDRVLARMQHAGYPPYRVGIQHMGLATGAGSLAAEIKRVLDPRGVLSPGRYDPPEPALGDAVTR